MQNLAKIWQCGAFTLAGLLMLLYSGYASATAAEVDRSGLNAIIEEVVVTARKREENSQDTPISITAVSGESLELRGFTSISEIDKIAPNTSYQNNPGAGGSSSVATVYIRGIGQRDFLGTIDNGVGFYIDDVYIARTVGAVVELLDVERVEVLRGPQGTLFGRNSVGGALLIHTRDPGEELSGYVDASVGVDSQLRLKGSVDLPLGDRAGARLSGLFSQQDGYVDRPAGGDLGDDDATAWRAVVRWDPTDSLELKLTADYSNEEENGPAFTLADTGTLVPRGFAGFHNNVVETATCAYPGGITSTNPVCYNNQWVSAKENFGTAPTYSDTEVWGTRLGVEWALSDEVTLKSISAYRDLDSEFARDADASPNLVTHFFDSFEAQQFSQELQLVGRSFDAALDWIFGLYYFDEEGENLNLLEFTIANFISGSEFAATSEAAYAQGTWHATDRLHLTAGVRYTDEDKEYSPEQTVGPNNIGLPIGLAIVPFGKNQRSTNEVTPNFNVAYDFTEQLMAYATYSEGFRSGGYVQRIFPPLPFVPEFDPEFVDSVEVGFKFTSDDGTLRFNGSLFRADYEDIQVRTQNPGFIGFFESNVGDAEIDGLELEFRWLLAARWILEASYGYTDAEYTEIRVQPPLVAQVNLDSEFDYVAEHTGSLSLSREFTLQGGSSLIARLGVSYHSGYFNNPDNTPIIETPAVDLWDLSCNWSSADERYHINGGIKNLTDDEYLTAGYNNTAIGFSERLFDRGRQWYLSGRVAF